MKNFNKYVLLLTCALSSSLSASNVGKKINESIILNDDIEYRLWQKTSIRGCFAQPGKIDKFLNNYKGECEFEDGIKDEYSDFDENFKCLSDYAAKNVMEFNGFQKKVISKAVQSSFKKETTGLFFEEFFDCEYEDLVGSSKVDFIMVNTKSNLGIASSTIGNKIKKIINGTEKSYIGTIIFNFEKSPIGESNKEYYSKVIAHEFGHMAGLDHDGINNEELSKMPQYIQKLYKQPYQLLELMKANEQNKTLDDFNYNAFDMEPFVDYFLNGGWRSEDKYTLDQKQKHYFYFATMSYSWLNIGNKLKPTINFFELFNRYEIE